MNSSKIAATAFVVATLAAVVFVSAKMTIAAIDVGATGIQIIEGAAPSVSPSGRANIYADSTTHQVLVSSNAMLVATPPSRPDRPDRQRGRR